MPAFNSMHLLLHTVAALLLSLAQSTGTPPQAQISANFQLSVTLMGVKESCCLGPIRLKTGAGCPLYFNPSVYVFCFLSIFFSWMSCGRYSLSILHIWSVIALSALAASGLLLQTWA